MTLPESETDMRKVELTDGETKKMLLQHVSLLDPVMSKAISLNFRVAQASKSLFPLFLLQPKES